METLETDDIYRGASLICMGAELSSLNRQGNKLLFTLSGQHLIQNDLQYRLGRAMVNPLQLKETLQLLRDIIFNRITLHSETSHARTTAN